MITKAESEIGADNYIAAIIKTGEQPSTKDTWLAAVEWANWFDDKNDSFPLLESIESKINKLDDMVRMVLIAVVVWIVSFGLGGLMMAYIAKHGLSWWPI